MAIAAKRHYPVFVALIILLSLIRVATTHLIFSQTLDEPAHVAGGHEWLTRGQYHLDFEHPPLPRVLFALPFAGVRAEHLDDKYEYGSDLYAHEGRYIHNVASARRPNLLFFAVACVALAAIARRLVGQPMSSRASVEGPGGAGAGKMSDDSPPIHPGPSLRFGMTSAALAAVLLFVSLPPVLAHAGLATTDMAGVAGFTVALHCLLLWCDGPSWWRTLLLAVAIAFGVSCKYSFVFFFPVAMVIVLIARRRSAPLRLVAAGLLAAVLVWGAFGFSFGTIAEANPGDAAHMAEAGAFPERIIHVPLPAPDLAIGLMAVRVHNRAGHFAFLLGRTSPVGWWYYFPVALAVKTPIPYLLLALWGAWL